MPLPGALSAAGALAPFAGKALSPFGKILGGAGKLIGKLFSPLGSLFSGIFGQRAKRRQDKLNFERQRAHNLEMAQLGWDRQVEMWNMTNAYNDPKAEMRRLKEAGLNPHLMYGSGAEANRAGSIDPQTPDTANYNVRPGFNPLELINAYQTVQQRQATHDLTRKNIEVQDQTKNIGIAEEALKIANLPGVRARSKQASDIAEYSAEVAEYTLKLKKQQLENDLKRGANLDQDFNIKEYMKTKESAKANITQKEWEQYRDTGIHPNNSLSNNFMRMIMTQLPKAFDVWTKWSLGQWK
jgi:hypothetical protein